MTTQAEYDELVARQMSERTLQARVEQMAKATGWLFYHTHRSDRSPAGFPDCVMVRRGRLIFAELKRQAKHAKPSPAQQEWLIKLGDVRAAIEPFLLRAGGCAPRPLEVFLWRPIDLLDGTIERALT